MDMVTKGIKHFSAMFDHFQSHKLTGGHHVHMEQPEQSAKLILNFINDKLNDN